jgi:hypothetical protein
MDANPPCHRDLEAVFSFHVYRALSPEVQEEVFSCWQRALTSGKRFLTLIGPGATPVVD